MGVTAFPRHFSYFKVHSALWTLFGRTLFICALYGSITIVSTISWTLPFLKSLGNFYRAFEIHIKRENPTNGDLHDTACRTRDMVRFVDKQVSNAKSVQKLTVEVTNGPQGIMSSKTHKSITMLYKGTCIMSSKHTSQLECCQLQCSLTR